MSSHGTSVTVLVDSYGTGCSSLPTDVTQESIVAVGVADEEDDEEAIPAISSAGKEGM